MTKDIPLFFANQKLVKTLAGLCADGRLSHAILLEGEEGLGKRTLSRRIAAMALCRERPGGCLRCIDCQNILNDNHPDVEIYGGEEGAGGLRIEDVRRLRRHAGIRPNQADRRVFILEDCGNMTPAAQNALLKILEEPPDDVLFILTVPNRRMLLSTVLSRVICFHLEALTRQEFCKALPQLIGHGDVMDLERLYLQSGGNLGLAIQMVEDERMKDQLTQAEELRGLLARPDEFAMLSLAARFERDKPGFLAVIGHLRRMLATGMSAQIRNQSQGEEGLGGLSTGQVMGVLDLIDETAEALGRSQNFGLTTTLFCASLNKICTLGRR